MPFVRTLQTYGGGPETEAPLNVRDFLNMPVRRCAGENCRNSTHLRKCGRCRTTVYCSQQCQAADYQNHKSGCRFIARHTAETFAGTAENPLQRNLRLFNARFEISLTVALICALDLRRTPGNISEYAVLVRVEPRTHAEAGSRFTLKNFAVFPMAEFEELLPGMADILSTHQQERASLRARTDGQRDFAAMAVLATNDGAEPLDGDYPPVLRFKPISVAWPLVNSEPAFEDSRLEWETALRVQIIQDIPSRLLGT